MARFKTNPLPPPHQQQHHHHYTPIPPDDQNYTVSSHPRRNNSLILLISLLTILATLVFIFYPSEPYIKIQRLHLSHIQVHTKPVICIDVTVNVTLKVQNVDVYSIDFKSLDVAVGYRGKRLGHVRSMYGHVRALGYSYIDAEIELDCVKVLSDMVFLLEDLAKGAVLFDTQTEVTGKLGLFFFEFPLKAKVSCEVLVNTNNQTILRQNCYTE